MLVLMSETLTDYSAPSRPVIDSTILGCEKLVVTKQQFE